MLNIKKDFKWEEVVPGDELTVITKDETESYMAIIHKSGKWYDLLYLTREECEYMPACLSYSSYEGCFNHIYEDEAEIEIRLSRKKDKEEAIEYAYDKGFKPRRKITVKEIESLLGFKIDIVE